MKKRTWKSWKDFWLYRLIEGWFKMPLPRNESFVPGLVQLRAPKVGVPNYLMIDYVPAMVF